MSRTRKSIGFAAFAGMLLATSLFPLAMSGLLDEQYLAYCLQASNAGDPVLGDPKCGAQVCAAFFKNGQPFPSGGICNNLNVHLANSSLLVRVLEHPKVSENVYLHAHGVALAPGLSNAEKWRNSSWTILAEDAPLPLEFEKSVWDDIPPVDGADVSLQWVHIHPTWSCSGPGPDAECTPASSTAVTGPFELYFGDPALVGDIEPVPWPA